MANIIQDHQSKTTWAGMSVTYLIKNDAGVDVPVNLTGASIVAAFKIFNGSENFSFKTADSTIIIPDPATGVFIINPALILAKEGTYTFDIFVTIGDNTSGILSGTWIITKHQPVNPTPDSITITNETEIVNYTIVVSESTGGGGTMTKAEIESTLGAASASNDGYLLSTDWSFFKTAYDWVTTNGTTLLSHLTAINNPHSVTKAQVGLGNVPNTDTTNPSNITQDAAHRFATDTEKGIWNAKESTSNKGAVNGYAGLDGNAKVPLANMNDAVLGNVQYQGLWDQVANSPALTTAETKGHYYICTGANETIRFGLKLNTGDWIISDGANWGKVDNTDAVSSVFGRTGNVTAQSGDYTSDQVTEGSSNLYYTALRGLSTLLTGLSTAIGGTILATDSILGALGKLQNQINSKVNVGAETIQSVYGNSTSPQLITTTALGALALKRGSATDTDNILVGQNGSGANTLLVDGNGKITAGTLRSNGALTAVSASAKGNSFTNTLTAAANNDDLTCLDLSPTFTNGAFTGVKNNVLKATWNTSNFTINDGGVPGNSLLYSVASPSANNYFFAASASTCYLNAPLVSGAIEIRLGNSKKGQFSPTTGNLILQNGGTFTDDNINRVQVGGSVVATQFNLSALNSAPATSSSTGTLGEIRFVNGFIYVCVATNTWQRTALSTF